MKFDNQLPSIAFPLSLWLMISWSSTITTDAFVIRNVNTNPLTILQERQPKPPRFSQIAHKPYSRPSSTSSSSPTDERYIDDNDDDDDDDNDDYRPQKKRTVQRRPMPSLSKNDPRYTEKSIDDLEGSLEKRWGTRINNYNIKNKNGKSKNFNNMVRMNNNDNNSRESSVFQIDFSNGKNDEFEDDDDKFEKGPRPVLDPWEKEEMMKNKKNKKNKSKNKKANKPKIIEFYDEDDEGYEHARDIKNLNDETKNPHSIDVAHLIKSRPAAGRGRIVDADGNDWYKDKADEDEADYFFNPNATEDSNDQAASLNANDISKNKAPGTEKADSTSKTSKRPRAKLAIELLDSDGNPLLLSLDQAEINFQEYVNAKENIAQSSSIGDDEDDEDEDNSDLEDDNDDDYAEYVQQSEFEDNDNDEEGVNDNEDDEKEFKYEHEFQDDDDDDDDGELLDTKPTTTTSWTELGITNEILLENLEAMDCPAPLTVQEKTIPPILTGNDVLVGTHTGSGKTLAFLLPLVEQLMLWNENSDKLCILIIAPGRELASQIASVAKTLTDGTFITVQLAIGGTTFTRNLEQIRKRKPNILVGTPGRVAELVVGRPGEKSGRLKIGALQSLVLDEFDALLEYKPHRDPTRAVIEALKRRHAQSLQSILCSATACDMLGSSKVESFLRKGYAKAMTDPDDVYVTGSTRSSTQVSRTVIHGVIHVTQARFVLETIRRILHTEPVPQQILIFVENSRKVGIVVEKLQKMNIVAAPLHGGMGSEKTDRAEVSKALRDGYVGIVVATELAARGLDAPLLTHVINLDLPTDASHYAHRAGRCGRGGRPGVVINITTSRQERKVPKRFAEALGLDMYTAEPRGGKLVIVDPTTQTLDGKS